MTSRRLILHLSLNLRGLWYRPPSPALLNALAHRNRKTTTLYTWPIKNTLRHDISYENGRITGNLKTFSRGSKRSTLLNSFNGISTQHIMMFSGALCLACLIQVTRGTWELLASFRILRKSCVIFWVLYINGWSCTAWMNWCCMSQIFLSFNQNLKINYHSGYCLNANLWKSHHS